MSDAVLILSINLLEENEATIKKIGISSGGGAAPGLNAVIRAVVIACLNHGWQCVGIRDEVS